MEMSRAEIEALLDQDLDDLFLRAGEEMMRDRLGARPPSRDRLIDRAKTWINENRDGLCAQIGKSQPICAYVKDDRVFGRVELFTSVSDVIIAISGGPSVATCSAIIVKQGIRELCPELKSSDSI